MAQGRVTDYFSTRKRNPALQPSKRRKVEVTSTQVDISVLDRTNSNQYRNITQDEGGAERQPKETVFSPLQTRAARKAKQSATVPKKATRARKIKVDPKQTSIEVSLASSTNESASKGILQISEAVTSSWDEHDGVGLPQQETPRKSIEETVVNGRKRGRNGKTTVKDDLKPDEATPEKRPSTSAAKPAETKARKKLQLIHKAKV